MEMASYFAKLQQHVNYFALAICYKYCNNGWQKK